MINKSCLWAMLGLCGSLLTVAAPSVSQEAAPPTQPAVTTAANPNTLTCVNLDRPGSRIKTRVCGTPAQWAAARGSLDLLVQNQAVSIGAVGVNTPIYSPSVPGMNGFGTGASQASFQR